jgi:hypothetical protein
MSITCVFALELRPRGHAVGVFDIEVRISRKGTQGTWQNGLEEARCQNFDLVIDFTTRNFWLCYCSLSNIWYQDV